MSRAINMKAIHLGEAGVFRAVNKRDASKFAVANGWRTSDVSLARNRFGYFWVVGQMLTTETFRLLRTDGSWLDIPWRGFCD